MQVLDTSFLATVDAHNSTSLSIMQLTLSVDRFVPSPTQQSQFMVSGLTYTGIKN